MQQCEWLLLFHDGGPYYIEISLTNWFLYDKELFRHEIIK